ncbi:hypothetical protein J27TS7_57880 [Paenibacillus dendritiformis]|uniref:hypothetical protein n=1 Tax=Paenibacillus dendritiformis TaxID=130049 RepID=UPI001B2848BA|nr:hypothetical protein [Paenibacillus dendritiformis]GIO76274.1 hypothetical protein J27TS7_57880 [Paenibacillus dendritiformis]
MDNRSEYGTIGLKANNGKFKIWGGWRDDEYYFGDYTDGRYAWELTDVKQLPVPIPAKGQQGLWNWQPQGQGGKES